MKLQRNSKIAKQLCFNNDRCFLNTLIMSLGAVSARPQEESSVSEVLGVKPRPFLQPEVTALQIPLLKSNALP